MGISSGWRFAASLAFWSALSFSFMPIWLGIQHNSTLILLSWYLCNRWWIQRITGWWLSECSTSMALLESVHITFSVESVLWNQSTAIFRACASAVKIEASFGRVAEHEDVAVTAAIRLIISILFKYCVPGSRTLLILFK